MNFKISLKFSCNGRFSDFAQSYMAAFTHRGSDVMYLSLLSVSVTVKKCDCNFSVKIKVPNFKTKFSGYF